MSSNSGSYLQELQSKYVLVPAEKATNNLIVVCKRYYLEVVLKDSDLSLLIKDVKVWLQNIELYGNLL